MVWEQLRTSTGQLQHSRSQGKTLLLTKHEFQQSGPVGAMILM